MHKWTKLDNNNFVGVYRMNADPRLFRLHAGRYGVNSSGWAYYLSTKLTSETEWKSLEILFQTKTDNYGDQKPGDQYGPRKESYQGKMWSAGNKDFPSTAYPVPDIDAIKKAVEEIAEAMY